MMYSNLGLSFRETLPLRKLHFRYRYEIGVCWPDQVLGPESPVDSPLVPVPAHAGAVVSKHLRVPHTSYGTSYGCCNTVALYFINNNLLLYDVTPISLHAYVLSSLPVHVFNQFTCAQFLKPSWLALHQFLSCSCSANQLTLPFICSLVLHDQLTFPFICSFVPHDQLTFPFICSLVPHDQLTFPFICSLVPHDQLTYFFLHLLLSSSRPADQLTFPFICSWVQSQ